MAETEHSEEIWFPTPAGRLNRATQHHDRRGVLSFTTQTEEDRGVFTTELALRFSQASRVRSVFVQPGGGQLLQIFAGIDLVYDGGSVWACPDELLVGVALTIRVRGEGMALVRWIATDPRRPTFIEREEGGL